MAVELLDDKKRWDQFVAKSPQGTLFHTWDFLKIVERHSGSHLVPYAIFSGNKLMCIFPFFIVRRAGFTAMRSPPLPRDTLIPYLGFAFDASVAAMRAHKREKIFQHVTDELCREIDKIAPNVVTFKTVPNFLDVRSFAWKNFSVRLMWTYAINLEKPIEQIWSSFSKNCRWGIKKVSALSPHIANTHDVSLVLDMWRERRKEHGERKKLFCGKYLEEIVAAFPERVTVHSASIDGRIAAAGACCALGEDRYALWIGGINARRDLDTNEFLIWEIIQYAKSKGFKTLDMVGAPTRGISAFKSKFDPVLELYYSIEKTDALGKVVNFVGAKLGKK